MPCSLPRTWFQAGGAAGCGGSPGTPAPRASMSSGNLAREQVPQGSLGQGADGVGEGEGEIGEGLTDKAGCLGVAKHTGNIRLLFCNVNPLPCGVSQAASCQRGWPRVGGPASRCYSQQTAQRVDASVQPGGSGLGEVRAGGELSERWQPWWSLEQDWEPDSKARAKWTPTFVELGSGVLLVCQSPGRTRAWLLGTQRQSACSDSVLGRGGPRADGLLSCPPHLGPGPWLCLLFGNSGTRRAGPRGRESGVRHEAGLWGVWKLTPCNRGKPQRANRGGVGAGRAMITGWGVEGPMGGRLGPPWGGEAGGQTPKNGADFHINRIPVGCASF